MHNFSLHTRMELALNGVLNAIDETDGRFLPYQNTFLNSAPAEMRHLIAGLDAGEIIGRFFIAIQYAKNMLGIDKMLPKEKKLLDHLHNLQDMNDIGVCGQMATPWSAEQKIAHNGEAHRMMLESFVLLCESGAEEYAKRIDRFIEGIFAREKEWSFFNADESQAMTDFNFIDNKCSGPTINPYVVSWILDPLVRYHELAEKKRAAELIEKIIIQHPILNSGCFKENGSFHGHVHSKLSGIVGLLRYARSNGRTDIIDKCRQSYEWFLANYGSSTGWCAELIMDNPLTEEDCETCCISNMIELALALAEITGDPVYYNDAETFGKNQLMEQQITSCEWIPEVMRRQNLPSDARRSYEDVLARSIGVFHGDAAPNDFIGHNPPCHFRTMTGCCGGWGTRALYLLWKKTFAKNSEGASRITMGFERDSAEFSYRVFDPYKGKVQIRSSTGKPFDIRIPYWHSLRTKRRFEKASFDDMKERWGGNWMDRRMVTCTINGKPVDIDTSKAFLSIPATSPGDLVEINYPLRWDKHEETIGARTYNLEWLGNYCVGIEPKGVVCPLYQREELKRGSYCLRAFPYSWPEREFCI